MRREEAELSQDFNGPMAQARTRMDVCTFCFFAGSAGRRNMAMTVDPNAGQRAEASSAWVAR
jgi:hypothetical protein